MDDFNKNPYFTNEVPQVEKKEVEFKKYEGNGIKQEEKKGFTSVILLAYFLNYPVFHLTGNCIGSIREHTDKEKTPYELILIINGSKGPKFEHLEDTYCDKVVVNEVNKGYTAGMNQGIRMATGEYVALVSNDTQVYNHWLEDFQESLQHLDYVMATPMYGMPFARAIQADILRGKTLGKPIQETFSDFADGSCVITRKQLFRDVGLMDEELVNYKSDVDLRKRMSKFGKKYASTKRVNIHHVIGATTIYQTREEQKLDETDRAFERIWGKT